MSTRGNNWALNARGLIPALKALLFALGERHNRDTGLCCPDQARLAEDACMSVRSVQRHLKTLEAMGFIERVKKSPNGVGVQTIFTLDFDRVEPAEGWEARDQSDKLSNDEGCDQSDSGDATKATLLAGTGNPKVNPNLSVPNGTEAEPRLFDDQQDPAPQKPKAPEDPYLKLIFSAGVPLLVEAGHSEKAARAFFGKLVKEHHTLDIANAITAAAKEKRLDPLAWIKAAVTRRTEGGGVATREEVAQDQRDAQLDEYFRLYAANPKSWRRHMGPRPDDPDAEYPDWLYDKHRIQRWERAG